MSFFNFLKQNKLIATINDNSVLNNIQIPEPTKSLVFLTDESTDKISNPFTIKITLDLNKAKTTIDDGHNFHGEPSLIWTRLPVEKNTDVETSPMYFPAYSRLSPRHRYQYLSWLSDIKKSTNLSYVFLYYYGLERHLLLGNFDLAASEILELLKYHDKGTFRSYAENALLVSAFYKNRFDIFSNSNILLDNISSIALVIRAKMKVNLKASEIIRISSEVGFKNKRYIKLYPKEFEKRLGENLVKFENEKGPVLNIVGIDDLRKEETLVFANMSIPQNIRTILVPQLTKNYKFRKTCLELLEKTHVDIKSSRHS